MVVAGSTMAGEEGQVLAAFARAGGGEGALLVLAPRHPERCDEVAALLAARGLPFRRRSALADAPAPGDRAAARPAVLILDTLGELAGLYRHAAAAFIGGTLVPTGGHNPLEPARFGVPVAAGPSMTNFRDIADRFDRAGAWRRVPDAEELGDVWRHWLDDPAAGRAVGARAADLVAANRGAVARTLDLLAPLLAPEGATGRRPPWSPAPAVGTPHEPEPGEPPRAAGGGARPERRAVTALAAPPPPRSPWQLLYGGAHRLRRRWYRGRARRLPRPVISVGNLHWGGGGKTPFSAALAAHLRDRGLHVCILSRGYASRGRGVRVVSVGDGPLLGPTVAGDEPVLLAGELPGVAVVVGADRHRAGLHALARLSPVPDLFLLDDGFSHLALARDLDLLVFPAADPFAGGRLAPAGRLREPLAAAARADAVVLTGAPAADAAGGAGFGSELAAALRPYGFGGPGFVSSTRLLSPVWRGSGGPQPLAPPARVLLVAGIVRPERFFTAVRRLGFTVAGELAFPDHHAYPDDSLAGIRAAFAAGGAEAVLATSKDQVKLLGRLDLPLAELPVVAEPEPDFWTWLEGRLVAIGVPLAAGATDAGEPNGSEGR